MMGSIGEREVVSEVTLPEAEAIRNTRVRVKGRGVLEEFYVKVLIRINFYSLIKNESIIVIENP